MFYEVFLSKKKLGMKIYFSYGYVKGEEDMSFSMNWTLPHIPKIGDVIEVDDFVPRKEGYLTVKWVVSQLSWSVDNCGDFPYSKPTGRWIDYGEEDAILYITLNVK